MRKSDSARRMAHDGSLLALGLEIRRSEFKCREVEARRHRAAHERPVAQAPGGLPDMGRNHALWAFVRKNIRAEPESSGVFAIFRKRQKQRRAGVEKPDFRGIAPCARRKPVRRTAKNKLRSTPRGPVRPDGGRERSLDKSRLRGAELRPSSSMIFFALRRSGMGRSSAKIVLALAHSCEHFHRIVVGHAHRGLHQLIFST